MLLAASSLFAQNIPSQNGSITDDAGIFSSSDRTKINNAISNLRNDNNIDLYVLTVYSLDGESIEYYSKSVFNSWYLNTDDLLIVFSDYDREVRVEIGSDLTSKLSNSTCSNIIEDYMIPEFKNNNYSKGIADGINQINKVLSGSTSNTNSNTSVGTNTGTTSVNKVCRGCGGGGLIILFIVIAIIGLFIRKIFRRGGGGNHNNYNRTNTTYRKTGGGSSHSSRSGGGA